MINVTYGARHRLYGSAFIFLSLFLSLGWLSANASAESLTITATVHSPPPSEPAIITSHHDGQHVNQSDTVIQGTCSNDTAYVELWRNNSFSGMAICSGGTFEIPFTFLPGPNVLYTKVLSSTGNPGPISSSITVFYDIEVPEPPDIIAIFPLLPPLAGTPCEARTSPLLLTLSPSYQPGSTGAALTWILTITNGCEPYKLSINWGDGVTTVEEIRGGTHTLAHTYYQPGTYLVQFSVTDAIGQRINIQSGSIIKGQTIDAPPLTHDINSWVIPTVTVALAVATVATTTATVAIFGRRIITRGIRWIFKK